MLTDHQRRLMIVLAVLGMLLYAVRLERSFAPEPAAPPPPRVALADDMELYETSLREGSPYSVNAFESVERTCRARADDATVARACSLFDDAVRNLSNSREIEQATRLLREGAGTN